MEETDAILPILQSMGFTYTIPVRAFDTEHLFSACAILLSAILNTQIEQAVPKSNAARFRLCADLANKLVQLGYTADIGYQTFLYPNANDNLNLMIFLIDKLPRLQEEGTGKEQDVDGRKVNRAIQRARSSLWTPFVGRVRVRRGFSGEYISLPYLFSAKELPNKQFSEYLKKDYRVVQKQTKPELVSSALLYRFDEDLAQQRFHEESVLRLQKKNSDLSKGAVKNYFQMAMENAKDVHKLSSKGTLSDIFKTFKFRKQEEWNNSNSFFRRTKFEDEVVYKTMASVSVEILNHAVVETSTEDDEAKKAADAAALLKSREEELQALIDEIEKYEKGISKSDDMSSRAKSEIKNMQEQLEAEGKATLELEKELRIKSGILDLLPNADENIRELTQLNQSLEERFQLLNEEWSKLEIPLLKQIELLERLKLETKEESKSKQLLLKSIRADIAHLSQQFKAKDALLKQLTEKFNSMPKSINRQVYVRKIMDIIKTYQMQKLEIERVLADIRSLQRDINNASEVTKRGSLSVRDTIYKAAHEPTTPDSTLVQSLETLITFENAFDEIVDSVAKIGKSRNEGRDLEVKIKGFDMDALQSKISKVRADWESVKLENTGLITRLKSA